MSPDIHLGYLCKTILTCSPLSYQELEELSLGHISQVDSRDSLMGMLKCLNNRRLHELANHLNLLEPVCKYVYT